VKKFTLIMSRRTRSKFSTYMSFLSLLLLFVISPFTRLSINCFPVRPHLRLLSGILLQL